MRHVVKIGHQKVMSYEWTLRLKIKTTLQVSWEHLSYVIIHLA